MASVKNCIYVSYEFDYWQNMVALKKSTYIYLKTLKTLHLIYCQFLPEDQIIPVNDNEIDKADQLACLRYKNQNVNVTVTSRK